MTQLLQEKYRKNRSRKKKKKSKEVLQCQFIHVTNHKVLSFQAVHLNRILQALQAYYRTNGFCYVHLWLFLTFSLFSSFCLACYKYVWLPMFFLLPFSTWPAMAVIEKSLKKNYFFLYTYIHLYVHTHIYKVHGNILIYICFVYACLYIYILRKIS